MSCVVDASFIASLFLPDESNDKVNAQGKALVLAGSAAPGLLQLEVISFLLVAHRRKRISGAQVQQLSEAFDDLPILLSSNLTAVQRSQVLHLAQKYGLTPYDAAYLELAIRLEMPLATLDSALRAAAASEGVNLAI